MDTVYYQIYKYKIVFPLFLTYINIKIYFHQRETAFFVIYVKGCIELLFNY